MVGMVKKISIGVAAFSHESNSFAYQPASLDKWKEWGILYGEEIRAEYETSKASIAGYYGRLRDEADVELVPLVFARLMPMGPITKEATEFLFSEILRLVAEEGPWDGLLLPLHGAAVSDKYLDADGEICAQIRDLVGDDVVIGASLDMHANVSQKIVEECDVVTIYQTNPHIDTYEQAVHCADLVLRNIRGEINPTMYLADPPLLVNILSQGTSDEPMAELLRVAQSEWQKPGALWVGIGEGYPYADVPEMGMTFLAITDGDPALAKEIADVVANRAWELKVELQGSSTSVREALERASKASAEQLAKGPVVLFDVGDNVGAGTPGDSTYVLHEARALGVRGVTQALRDADVAAQCHKLGVGVTFTGEVGGKCDELHGKPFPIIGVITSVSDGKYEETKPVHGGFRFFDDGPSAVIKSEDGFTILVTTFPAMSASLDQFRASGVDPVKEKIMVVKGVHSPRPAYEPIGSELIWLSTAGASTADLSTFTYKNIRKPLYPLQKDATYIP
jgi:microcystin degradation protein MlrC